MLGKVKSAILLALMSTTLTGTSGCESGHALELMKMNQPNDISSYTVNGDQTFVPISYERINDGTNNGSHIIQYVDVIDGSIWVEMYKFQSGYGVSFTQKMGIDGKPVLYNGDLEALKNKYNDQ